MTQDDFQKLTYDVFQECDAIMNAKGPDYSGTEDRLANFKVVAQLVGITPRQVLGVYMAKHYTAIFKWIRGEELSGEPISAKLDDNINYSVLARALDVEEQSSK